MSIGWKTVSVTALPPGVTVTLSDGYGGQGLYHALALLHQTVNDDYRGVEGERIVLGVLNPERGEVEPIDVDDDDSGSLGDLCDIHINGESAG